MSADASLDLLLDLKHDLGKYLVLPFALLPKDAAPPAVREALSRALRETRKGPGGAQSARELWRGFESELTAAVSESPAMGALRAAVDRALAWERALDGVGSLDRAAAERDLRAVQGAIAALIDEVQRG